MKDVMPIEDLPEYLKSARNHGEDSSPVVDMGRIVPNNSGRFRVATLIGSSFLILALSLATYKTFSEKNITVLIDAENTTFQTVSELIVEDGAKVISMKKKDNRYEVKIAVKDNLKSFLEKIRNRKEIEKVEIKN